MTLAHWLGLALLLLFGALLIVFRVSLRARPGRELRPIGAYLRLQRALGEAVEAGRRLHLTIGRGEITGVQSAAGLMGLVVAERIARVAAVADRPPVVTSGTGPLGLLSQGVVRGTFADSGMAERYHPALAQISGLTPYAYAAGTMTLADDPANAATAILGSVGPEAALIVDAGETEGRLVVAGTDHVPTQAVLYAAAAEPLIGEELYAAGAYLGADPFHSASLRVQDVLRWLFITVMLVGGLLKLAGVWP